MRDFWFTRQISSEKKFATATCRRRARRWGWLASSLIGAVVLSWTTGAQASDVRVLSANVFTGVLDAAFHAFESESGSTIHFQYATAGMIAQRVRSGEPGDVVIVTRALMDGLSSDGKIAAGTEQTLARSAVALVVRNDAAKPDIGSIDAFAHVLSTAKTISYPDPARGGATGILFSKILKRLNLTAEIGSKTKFPPVGHFAVELVANGQADIAIAQPMEALQQAGVQVVGALPAELQDPPHFTFVVAQMTASTQPKMARLLIQFLTNSSVQSMLQKSGMAPANQ
jgi:molybdate transport system substrate-binding protein